MTNMPKFRTFCRVATGSLCRRMTASMNTIQSRRLCNKAFERVDQGFWSHASRPACSVAAAFKSKLASTSRGSKTACATRA